MPPAASGMKEYLQMMGPATGHTDSVEPAVSSISGEVHSSLSAPDQRQSGAVHPNGVKRVGIRANVYPLMEEDSLPAEMDSITTFSVLTRR